MGITLYGWSKMLFLAYVNIHMGKNDANTIKAIIGHRYPWIQYDIIMIWCKLISWVSLVWQPWTCLIFGSGRLGKSGRSHNIHF